MKILKEVIQAFDEKALQSYISIHKCLTRHGFGVQDLIDRNQAIVDEQKELEEEGKKIVEEETRIFKKEQDRWEKIAPKCPDCEDVLVRPAKLCGKNIPTNQRGFSCHWFCIKGWDEDEPSGICGWERYTKEDAVEITRNLLEGRIDGYNIP